VKHILSLSGGKDSTFLLLELIRRNYPLDEVVFFDTGWEFPAMYEHIEKLKKICEEHYIIFVTLQPDVSFDYLMFDKDYSWCGRMCRWGTACKTQVIDRYLKDIGEYVIYVGIASDEPERVERNTDERKKFPLVDWGITEAECLQGCYDAGFDFGGMYKHLDRLSCKFCRNKNLKELRNIYRYYPDVWEELKDYQSRTPYPYRPEGPTIHDLECRFKFEEKRQKQGLSITNNEFHRELETKELRKMKAERTTTQPDFLYDYQKDAVKKMRNGCILNGGVGSGKSRTGLYYYFSTQGGSIEPDYKPMKRNPKPKDLYIITTAMKRDKLEWEKEIIPFRLSTDPKFNAFYGNKVVIDSWNNIKKYAEVRDAFFIFDEDKVTGYGVWVKAFLNIAKFNEWVILSATPGDTWSDYIPVFIANGFYRNKTHFANEHIIWSRHTSYPKIERFYNTGKLIRLRNSILIDMDFERHTVPHHEDIFVRYDIVAYKDAMKKRWDPFKNEPIQQAAGLCYVLRKIVNSDESRATALLEILEDHPKAIIFYNFDYELDILMNLAYETGVKVAQWNGHQHDPVPDGNQWVYLVQYTAGAEGWNCITTDTVIFYSQNYSYKAMNQAAGRIDRANTPFTNLYYYHLKSRSGIDLAITKALRDKKQFNEGKFVKW